MVFDQGDIIEVDFDPTKGREPQKKRLALVVSKWEFNLSNSMTIVCPISSREKPFALHEPLPDGCCVSGSVIMEQVRAVDLDARSCRKLGSLEDSALQPILICLRSFF